MGYTMVEGGLLASLSSCGGTRNRKSGFEIIAIVLYQEKEELDGRREVLNTPP